MAYIKVVERTQSHKYRDDNTYDDLIHYCSNPAKMASYGLINLHSIETAPSEMEMIAQTFKKTFGKRISHTIISFSKQEVSTISLAENIAAVCASYYANRYQVFYCVHMEPNPHIHMIMNRVSFVDGMKYPDKYADRSSFWQHVRYVLNGYGIFLWK